MEEVADLREFHKFTNGKAASVKKGDIVLLQEDNIKRGQWKLAMVEEIIY